MSTFTEPTRSCSDAGPTSSLRATGACGETAPRSRRRSTAAPSTWPRRVSASHSGRTPPSLPVTCARRSSCSRTRRRRTAGARQRQADPLALDNGFVDEMNLLTSLWSWARGHAVRRPGPDLALDLIDSRAFPAARCSACTGRGAPAIRGGRLTDRRQRRPLPAPAGRSGRG